MGTGDDAAAAPAAVQRPDEATRYRAVMQLSAAGDAIGYFGGRWEFEYSGPVIHVQLKQLGGLEQIDVSRRSWPVSDDTVLHLATAEALIEEPPADSFDELMHRFARHYVKGGKDMAGRGPGRTTMLVLSAVEKSGHYRTPFNPNGGGCGASMRSACIGLRYPRPEQEDELIRVAVESGRITHHHPLGYLGGVAAALFTAYALQGRPIESWGRAMLDTLPKVCTYVANAGVDIDANLKEFGTFERTWINGLKARNVIDGIGPAKFPEVYDVRARDAYYASVSHGGWGGACGDDSVLIAYDALLGAGNSWSELILRGALHGGDSDSTGTIAAALFGALYGFTGVPKLNYEGIEYEQRLIQAADRLYALSRA